MLTAATVSLLTVFTGQPLKAGDANEAYVEQNGVLNNTVADQSNANQARIGSAALPFVQDGTGNVLTILQEAPNRLLRGPQIATQEGFGAFALAPLSNGFQLGNLNILSITQRDTSAEATNPQKNNSNSVPLVYQSGTANIGIITQDAAFTWNFANLRQLGNANFANLDQEATDTGSNRQNRNGIGRADTVFTGNTGRQGGALQDGSLNAMTLTQLANVGNGANTIYDAIQRGNANDMTISQTGNNFGLDFGTAGAWGGYAGSLGVELYTATQDGDLNDLNLSMTSGGTENFFSAGVVFATQQNGEANGATVSLTGDFTEFAMIQDGAINNLVGIGVGNSNDLAVRQIGVDTTVAPIVVPPVRFFGVVIIPGFTIPGFTIPGGNNDAQFDVAGDDNEMFIDQAGNSNDVTVDIDGDSNVSENIQTGDRNDAVVVIAGDTNRDLTTQTGDDNTSDVTITGDLNAATLTQIGDDNDSDLSITGDSNASTTAQNGNANDSSVTITGDFNTASLTQSGDDNGSVVSIEGDSNGSTTTQTGNANDSSVTITGDFNTATQTQTGNSNDWTASIIGNTNVATLLQSGNDNVASLTIDGDFNSSTLTSLGNDNSITGTVDGNSNQSTVLQSGNSNIAVFAQNGNFNSLNISQ